MSNYISNLSEYKNKINIIKNIDYKDEEIEPSNQNIIYEAEGIFQELLKYKYYPYRISESAEGGIFFIIKIIIILCTSKSIMMVRKDLSLKIH